MPQNPNTDSKERREPGAELRSFTPDSPRTSPTPAPRPRSPRAAQRRPLAAEAESLTTSGGSSSQTPVAAHAEMPGAALAALTAPSARQSWQQAANPAAQHLRAPSLPRPPSPQPAPPRPALPLAGGT